MPLNIVVTTTELLTKEQATMTRIVDSRKQKQKDYTKKGKETRSQKNERMAREQIKRNELAKQRQLTQRSNLSDNSESSDDTSDDEQEIRRARKQEIRRAREELKKRKRINKRRELPKRKETPESYDSSHTSEDQEHEINLGKRGEEQLNLHKSGNVTPDNILTERVKLYKLTEVQAEINKISGNVRRMLEEYVMKEIFPVVKFADPEVLENILISAEKYQGTTINRRRDIPDDDFLRAFAGKVSTVFSNLRHSTQTNTRTKYLSK